MRQELLGNNVKPTKPFPPLKCRLLGHKWQKSVGGDFYYRIGTPNYWSVRSYCIREFCPAARYAELAGINPRVSIPWNETLEHPSKFPLDHWHSKYGLG